MSLVSAIGGSFPCYMGGLTSLLGTGFFVLDAADEKAAGIFHIPLTGTLEKIAFRTSNVVEGDTLKIRLESVNAGDFKPSGTLLVANAEGTQATPTANTTFWVALNSGAGVSVTAGTPAAVVIQWDDFAGEGGDGDVDILYTVGGTNPGIFPYAANFETGAGDWAAVLSSPNFGLQYSGGDIRPIPGGFPAVTTPIITFSNASDPDEIGNILQVPIPLTAYGASGIIDNDSDIEIKLYDTDGTTVLATALMNKNHRGTGNPRAFKAVLDTPVDLLKDVNYRITYKPTEAVNIRVAQINATDDGANKGLDGLEGRSLWHRTEKSNPGDVWTETDTSVVMLNVLFSQLDDGTGGAGGGLLMANKRGNKQ